MIARCNLISPAMVAMNQQLHNAPPGYGGSGWKHARDVLRFITVNSYRSVLDYGCGEGTLKRDLMRSGVMVDVHEYDPAIPGKDHDPEPADLVVCTDVLEHVEPDKLSNVLRHISDLTKFECYLVIALRPSNKLLPDGRNTHLIIEDEDWWLWQLRVYTPTLLPVVIERFKTRDGEPHSFTLRMVKSK